MKNLFNKTESLGDILSGYTTLRDKLSAFLESNGKAITSTKEKLNLLESEQKHAEKVKGKVDSFLED